MLLRNRALESTVCAAVVMLVTVAFTLSLLKNPGADELGASTSFEEYTGSIHVNVTDNAGRPVTDAEVTLEGNQSWYADDDGMLNISG
ncbi:MAG: hypothetical protein OEM29_06220, partial [Thermoplasmata archaeon]|nr:hypothetical protein [Thermoplasmata archaeon]